MPIASQTILGLEPLVDADGECKAAITHTWKVLDRRSVSDADTPVTLMKCNEARTIVCASHGVAVMADSSSDTADAVFVRFDPRGSSKDVSAPTPLPESATLMSAAVAPDGQLLVGGTRSGQVKVWSLAPENAGKLLRTFKGHGHAWVTCVAVNKVTLHSTLLEQHPDAKYVAVSGSWHGATFAHFISESSLASVQLSRSEEEHEPTTDEQALTAADVSPDGSLVAAGCRSGEVILWETASGEEKHRCRARRSFRRFGARDPDASVSAVKFNTARFWVLIAHRQPELIEVMDLESKVSVTSVRTRAPRCVSWVGDSAQFMYSRDHTIAVETAQEAGWAQPTGEWEEDWDEGGADWDDEDDDQHNPDPDVYDGYDGYDEDVGHDIADEDDYAQWQ